MITAPSMARSLYDAGRPARDIALALRRPLKWVHDTLCLPYDPLDTRYDAAIDTLALLSPFSLEWRVVGPTGCSCPSVRPCWHISYKRVHFPSHRGSERRAA